MKRIFVILGLTQIFLLLSFTTVANAGDQMQLGICSFGYSSSTNISSVTGDQPLNDKVKTQIETNEKAYNDKYQTSYITSSTAGSEFTTIPDDAYCGKENPSTKFVEKGDCSSQVISEVSEIVSSATPTTETGSDKIVNLYQGACCLIYDDSNNCYETRTYYTDTYDKCVVAANGASSGAATVSGDPNCSLRQWIIASTGMGLLKLYVKQIFTFGAYAVGIIAVANIIFNGIRISMAGVSGDISEAKQKITQSLSGIVLLFLAALILYSINPDFFS